MALALWRVYTPDLVTDIMRFFLLALGLQRAYTSFPAFRKLERVWRLR